MSNPVANAASVYCESLGHFSIRVLYQNEFYQPPEPVPWYRCDRCGKPCEVTTMWLPLACMEHLDPDCWRPVCYKCSTPVMARTVTHARTWIIQERFALRRLPLAPHGSETDRWMPSP